MHKFKRSVFNKRYIEIITFAHFDYNGYFQQKLVTYCNAFVNLCASIFVHYFPHLLEEDYAKDFQILA